MEIILTNKVALHYADHDRSYSIYAHPDTKGRWRQLISHCPFCGTKLPKELGDEWYEEAKQYETEEGIEEENLPERLRTGGWWRSDPKYAE